MPPLPFSHPNASSPQISLHIPLSFPVLLSLISPHNTPSSNLPLPSHPIPPPASPSHPIPPSLPHMPSRQSDASFVIVGSPLSRRCPLTALLEAVLAALGTEQGAGRLSALGGAQAQVGGTRLAQSPVALRQFGQILGIQQGLAAGGHGRGHGRGCGDSEVVGIPTSSLPPAPPCLGHPRVGGDEAWWGCCVLVGSPEWGRISGYVLGEYLGWEERVWQCFR